MLDFRERGNDPFEAFHTGFDGRQRDMWTALPGHVLSFDPEKMTAVVQPSIQAVVTDIRTGKKQPQNLPKIPDVPMHLPRGGGYTVTLPIKAGDEVLLVFCSRNIDNAWQHGGTQPPWDKRMHDLSDAYAIPGTFSQAKKIENWNGSTAQLRSDDGKRYIELDNDNDSARLIVDQTEFHVDNRAGEITAKARTKITLDTPVVEITGVIGVTNVHGGGPHVAVFNGTAIATEDFISQTISGRFHRHSNSGGSGDGGPPIPLIP